MDNPNQEEFAPEDKYLPDPFPPVYADMDLDDNDMSCSGLL